MTHSESEFSLEKADGQWEKAMFHWKFKEGSILGGFGIMEWQESGADDHCFDACFTEDNPAKFNNGENFLLEIGYRPKHNRNWSWFWKLSVQKIDYEIRNNYYIENDVNDFNDDEFYNLNRTESWLGLGFNLGVDYLWKFGFWKNGGMYFAAEAYYTTSITHQETKLNECDFPGPNGSCENLPPFLEASDQEISIYGALLSAGLMLRF